MTKQDSKPFLGIIASEKCRTNTPGKRWWHLRRFVDVYGSLLSQYRIIATSHTKEILEESWENNHDKQRAPNLDIKDIGPEFEGVVRLAAYVARRKVDRVLWFQDPLDLRVDRPENYALLRNCNLAGAHLLINAAAHLWALYHFPEGSSDPATRYITKPYDVGDLKETVILIAHDAEKPRMSRFVKHYHNAIAKFPRVTATSGTLREIQEFLKEHIPPWQREKLNIEAVGKTATMAHGPSGGDVIVADEIYKWYGPNGRAYNGQYILHHILFFTDNRRSHPHEADIRVLLKTCVNPKHRVNLILNSRMAEEWANRYL